MIKKVDSRLHDLAPAAICDLAPTVLTIPGYLHVHVVEMGKVALIKHESHNCCFVDRTLTVLTIASSDILI